MKSFDCWDTLIARRSIVDIHNETNNLFPVAENVAKVKPGDIFVSDFYDAELLKKIMPEVTGLHNQLFCSGDGKYVGWIWPQLKQQFNIEEHIGDNTHSDISSPRNHGINATLSALTGFTVAEKEMDDAGMHGLARTMRETRLVTWSDKYRQQQLVQSQVNFPLLMIASMLLHRTNPTKLLMVSRDCCLWQYAQKLVRDQCGSKYEIEYFKASRIAIAAGKESYMEYVNRMLPGTIVDYATGPNQSLLKLVKKSKYPDTQIITIIYSRPNGQVSGLLNAEPRSVHTEFMNFDRHAMYASETESFNPIGIDWENIPEITTMHETFLKACDIAKYYDYYSDLHMSDQILKALLDKCLWRVKEYDSAFQFAETFFLQEHNATMNRLNEIAQGKI